MIAKTTPLDDVVWTEQSTNLTFMPAAIKTHFIHSSDVLATDAAKERVQCLNILNNMRHWHGDVAELSALICSACRNLR